MQVNNEHREKLLSSESWYDDIIYISAQQGLIPEDSLLEYLKLKGREAKKEFVQKGWKLHK